jgi:hypothetical protein
MALAVDLLWWPVLPTFLDVRIRSGAALGHTRKGVERLRDFRYVAGRGGRCKFSGDSNFNFNCDGNFGGEVNGWRSEDRRYISNSAARHAMRLAFFGFLELG